MFFAPLLKKKKKKKPLLSACIRGIRCSRSLGANSNASRISKQDVDVISCPVFKKMIQSGYVEIYCDIPHLKISVIRLV